MIVPAVFLTKGCGFRYCFHRHYNSAPWLQVRFAVDYHHQVVLWFVLTHGSAVVTGRHDLSFLLNLISLGAAFVANIAKDAVAMCVMN